MTHLGSKRAKGMRKAVKFNFSPASDSEKVPTKPCPQNAEILAPAPKEGVSDGRPGHHAAAAAAAEASGSGQEIDVDQAARKAEEKVGSQCSSCVSYSRLKLSPSHCSQSSAATCQQSKDSSSLHVPRRNAYLVKFLTDTSVLQAGSASKPSRSSKLTSKKHHKEGTVERCHSHEHELTERELIKHAEAKLAGLLKLEDKARSQKATHSLSLRWAASL